VDVTGRVDKIGQIQIQLTVCQRDLQMIDAGKKMNPGLKKRQYLQEI
jgi:hypothetical protein